MEAMALWRSCIAIGMLPAACCSASSKGRLSTKPRISKHSPIAIDWLKRPIGGVVQAKRPVQSEIVKHHGCRDVSAPGLGLCVHIYGIAPSNPTNQRIKQLLTQQKRPVQAKRLDKSEAPRTSEAPWTSEAPRTKSEAPCT